MDLDGAGRVQHGVLGEGGGVEEVVHRPALAGPVHDGEPRAAVGGHGALERVDAVGPAQVCLVGLAVGARPALAVEDGDHMVAGGEILHSLAQALHHSAHDTQVPYMSPSGARASPNEDVVFNSTQVDQ